jgi:sarcosine oxidase gamma subunit
MVDDALQTTEERHAPPPTPLAAPSRGVRLFAFGGDDFFIIADLPDNAAAAALALTVSASGAVNVRTVVLLTPEEVDAATKLSPSYRAPGR